MQSFFQNFFISNWDRKLVSLFLAVVIWLVVNHSQTTTKTLDNVPVRLINVPQGMTVEGLQPSGIMSKKVTLSLQGNKSLLSEITSNDVEIVLDAMDKSDEWVATISRKTLFSLNPDINILKAIKSVSNQRLLISFTRLITEKIPLIVTKPIGEPPRDYQFVDVWPYRLSITVSGPEEVVKKLKANGMNLTFNLNDISRLDLEIQENKSDEVSFFIPDSWKQIDIPLLSDRPFQIDDSLARDLRIDFVKNDLFPIAKEIPLILFFPPKHSLTLNPETYSLAIEGAVQQFHGLTMLRRSLYAKGVSQLFAELVQDMIEISILLAPKTEQTHLDWNIQFLNPRTLEEKYISILMSDDGEQDAASLKRREDYLRSKFRNYMNNFQLYKSNGEKLNLKIELQDHHVVIQETPDASKNRAD